MKRILSLILAAILMIVATPLNSTAAAINPALASYYRGDTDGDWSVTTADARMLLAASLLNTDLTAYPQYDINGDGALTSADARDVLIETVTEVPPTLISPTVTQVDTLPEGEEVEFTELSSLGACAVTTDDVEFTSFIAQSPEEFQAIYETDNIIGSNYTEAYDNAYFDDYAIILIKIFMLETPKDVHVSGVYRNNSTLTIHVTEEFYHGTLPAPWGTRILLGISKSELNDITELQMYGEQDRPSFE